jgi:hypothetical protein
VRTAFAPWVSEVRYFGNDASNNYHSLQTQFYRRFSRDFGIRAHYVWSKVLNYDSTYFAIDPRVGYGPANFDVRHSFVFTETWSLPIGHGHALLGKVGRIADALLGGWSLNSLTSWHSGFPFTPTYSCLTDLQNSGVGVGRVCRPNHIGPIPITGDRDHYFIGLSGSQFLTSGTTPCGIDPSSGTPEPGPSIGPWQRPGCGQIGNIGRNSLRGPGFFQSDVSLIKRLPLREGIYILLRADSFNIFNKVNLANPNPRIDTPQAGAITSLAPGAFQRQFQLSAKLEF